MVLMFQSYPGDSTPGIPLQVPMIAAQDHSHLLLRSRSDDSDNDKGDERVRRRPCRDKDDCFGFMSFLNGMAVGDVVFTGSFVFLSLAVAFCSPSGWLEPDTKRPTIVNRKILL